MAEATIDELQIEISTSSGSAADNLEKLAQKLERLGNVIQPIATNNGLEKIAKQLNKLSAISQKISQLSGFEKIGQVVSELRKIEQLGNAQDISPFMRNLNKLPRIVAAISQMPSVDATKFQQLADALKPLQSMNSSGINSLMNALRKLPKLSQELSGVDFTRFSRQIEQISRAIEPLARQAERAGQGLTAIAQIMQNTSRQARQSASGFGLFNQAIGNIKVKTLAAVAALRRLFSVLKNGVTASAAYVENLNLFSVTMGESADEALRFAESVNSALGIDTSDWIRYQGFFQSIGKGFGIASAQSDLMSKNLTQLSFDLSSFFNTSVDEAYTKIQSGFAGEMEPLRRLGFALDEATLKQLAFNKGIKTSFENMTQAQKAQLRYVAIMEQVGNIGVLGDMARTIDTASNSMRVFQARLQQFSRAIGNMFMPILSAALPYLTAFVQVLTEGAQAIANFFGFELPKIDFSDAQITSGFGDITGAIDEATEANEKFKGSLASIDQLNIIGSESESKNAANMGNQFDLGINLPEYDFLQGVESKTKQIAEDIKGWFKEALPWIEAVGAAIGAVFVTSKINNFIGLLKNVGNVFSTLGNIISGKFGKSAQIFGGIAGGLAAGAASGILLYNSIKNLTAGVGNATHNWIKFAGGIAVAGAAIALFIKFGNPLGAVITAVGAAIGLAAGAAAGIKEVADQNVMNKITEAFERGLTPISDVADALGRVASNLTSSENNYLTAKTDLLDISNNAQSAGTQIDNMISSLKGAGTLSETELNTMTKAFEDLAKASDQYIKKSNDNFKLYILANQDVLKAQGYSVSSMVELINQSTESSTAKINELEARSKQLTDLQRSSGLDETQIMELENINKQLLQMSGIDIELNLDTKNAEDVLNSLTSIKFEDPENAATEIERALETVSEAYAALEETRKGLFSDIDNLMLDDPEKETLRNAITSLMDSKKALYDEKFARPLEQIIRQTEALGYSIQAAEQLGTAEGINGIINNPFALLFNEDVRAGIGGKTTEEINDAKVKERLGEAASTILNPWEKFYLTFANKGLSKDYADSIFGGLNEERALAAVRKTIETEMGVDWSKFRPPLADTSESAKIGYAREAYSQAAQYSPNGYNNADGMEAKVTIYNYLEMDNDTVAEKVNEVNARLAYRNNGR